MSVSGLDSRTLHALLVEEKRRVEALHETVKELQGRCDALARELAELRPHAELARVAFKGKANL